MLFASIVAAQLSTWMEKKNEKLFLFKIRRRITEKKNFLFENWNTKRRQNLMSSKNFFLSGQTVATSRIIIRYANTRCTRRRTIAGRWILFLFYSHYFFFLLILSFILFCASSSAFCFGVCKVIDLETKGVVFLPGQTHINCSRCI